MGGRFGKYGDIKRKQKLRRGGPEKKRDPNIGRRPQSARRRKRKPPSGLSRK